MAGAQLRRKVDHQQVDLATGDEGRGQRPAFVDICRPKHEQPAQVHAAPDSLQRIEDAAQIEERDDSAAGLGLGQAVQAQARSCRWSVRHGKKHSRHVADRPCRGARRAGQSR